MKHAIATAGIVAAISLSGCASNGSTVNRTLIGSGAGAVLGAAAAAATGGDPFGWAAAGSIAGGAAGAVMKPRSGQPTQWYRDSRGYCYFVDRRGQPVYDYTINC